MRVRRTLAAVSLAAVLAATASCSDDDPPEPDGSPRASESPSATTTSSSPTETDPPQRESAKAFIRRWNEAEVDLQNSGDTELYREITKGCKACDAFATRVENIYAAGGEIHFGGRSIQSIKKWGTVDGRTTWEVAVTSKPTTYKESATGPTKRLPGGSASVLVTIHRMNGEWRVVETSNLAQ